MEKFRNRDMSYFPAFLEIQGKKALVVGGEAMAARRAKMAQRAKARVTVIAETLSNDFDDLTNFEHVPRGFIETDLDGAAIVFVAVNDKVIELEVASKARRLGILVNVADRQELCSFIVPSIIDRAPMFVAVSSGGEAPILSRMLRAKLETIIPSGYGRLARFAKQYRKKVSSLIKDPVLRRRFWENFSQGKIAEQILSGQIEQGKAMMELAIESEKLSNSGTLKGEVYLVGSGPGDPDLLTFRAFRLMQKADIVLHDRLVPDEVLELVRRDADRLFVGKKRGDHVLPQDEISALLIKFALDGQRVLRLKGGDPFTFGRGGEEIEALASRGIPFQVVPGISAANGCAAYAGIPLTHRDHAQSCIFVTGHTKEGKLDLNWANLIGSGQTVVVYMGLNSLKDFLKSYIDYGGDKKMPAALIDNGTRLGQQVICGVVDTLGRKVEKANLDGPAMVIIGTVVTLRDSLSWYEGNPPPSPLESQKL